MSAAERLAAALATVGLLGIDGLVPERILAADPALADAIELGLAWQEAEAALPEGMTLMVGYTNDCSFCHGWWATASKRVPRDDGWLRLVSSETDRPRGEHHDATPAVALRALAEKLRGAT